MLSEILEQRVSNKKLHLFDVEFVDNIDGMLVKNGIFLNKRIDNSHKRNRILLHEIIHSDNCQFNLIEAPKTTQEKYEAIATRNTVFECVPIGKLVCLCKSGLSHAYEFAEELEIDEDFFYEALKLYHSIYGYNYEYDEYVINFMPLKIIEIKDGYVRILGVVKQVMYRM